MKGRHSRVLPQFLAWTLEWRMVLFAKMEKTDFGSRRQEFSYVLTELEKPDTLVGNWRLLGISQRRGLDWRNPVGSHQRTEEFKNHLETE